MNYDTKLPPFKWFILENFPYIEEDFDALTNWQLFCKLGKEMNKIIQKCNLTGEQVEQLTNAFNSLQNYVNNYFENLDVQDEIDNKLDEMAEQGVLTDIIAQYLQLAGVLAYDTKQAMKSATNLTEGSITKTLGNLSYQDGQGAFYKVRQIQNIDVVDDENIIALNDPNLVAEKIPYSSGYVIQQQINTINSNVDIINSERTILIGDSYSLYRPETQGIEGWAVPLRRKLGLSETDCPILTSDGGGFTTTGSLGTFENAIRNATISDPSTIKNIIVCGGLNDIQATDTATIKSAISSFMSYVKTNFVNAKVYIGMIGWNLDIEHTTDNQFIRYQVLTKVLPAYQDCNEYGAIYLNGVENVMHDKTGYYDPAHPNQAMCERLARYIYQAFKNGYASVTYPEHLLSFDDAHITTNYFSVTERVVNNETIIFDNHEYGNQINFTSNNPTIGNYTAYIGELNTVYITSTYMYDELFTCPCIVKDVNDVQYQCVATAFIKYFNYLYVRFYNNTDVEGKQIKEINFLSPYTSKPTITH